MKPPHSKEAKLWKSWNLYINPNFEPKRLIRKGLKMVPVKKISEMGEEKVYDITTPKTHNFIANGIVVHNSMATPHMAGLAALLYERKGCRTASDIKERMREVGLEAKNVARGWGLVNYDYY